MNDDKAEFSNTADDAEKPKPLYHYTDINGLLGIVRTTSIWATEIHYLNDSKEYRYAAELVEEYALPYFNSLEEIPSRYLRSFVDSAKIIAHTAAFVACLTEKRDDLSQWRAYTHGGSGFCIGFNTTKLAQLVKSRGLRLLPCEYSEDEQKRLLVKLIEDTIDAASSSLLSSDDSEIYAISQTTITSFMELATRFKHPKFSEEKEHRIATKYMGGHPDLDIQLRPAANLLVPYVEIPFSNTPGNLLIDEILIGPCSEPSLAYSSINHLIMSCSIAGTKVDNSEIPFRNW